MKFHPITPSGSEPIYPQAVVLLDPNSGTVRGRGPRFSVRGAYITTGASSAYVAIPNTSTGEAPNAVRLSATANAWVRMGAPLEATVADAAAGDGYLIGDALTVAGGTFSTAMTLAVATTKLNSAALNASSYAAITVSYAVNDVVTLLGGTAATKATLTLSKINLASAVQNAAGTLYESGQVITTAGATGTAPEITINTTKVVSAAVNAHGTNVTGGQVFTAIGGTSTAPATLAVATMDLATAPTVSGNGTGYVPTDEVTLGVTGSTASVKAVVTVATTQVVGTPTIFAAGAGGDLVAGAGTIVEGTTGTGAKFRASVTIGAASDVVSVESVTIAGSYTVNPTNIAQEPVTYISGNAGTTLTGAVLGVTMGMETVTLTTPGTYTVGGTGATVFSTNSVAGAGGAFTGCSFGAKTVTVATGGAYTGAAPAAFTVATNGVTFQTIVFGVGTFSITNRGDLTVGSAALTQAGSTAPDTGGAGATFQTCLYAPKTWTVSEAGIYSATVTALTQTVPAPASGGAGASWQTASYGVLTATVTDPGAYTIDPSNPVATTGGGDNAATFNVTMVTAAAAGDILITPSGDGLIVDATGFDHVAAIRVSGDGVLSISPIEN